MKRKIPCTDWKPGSSHDKDQLEWSEEKCKTGYKKFEELYHRCKAVDGHRKIKTSQILHKIISTHLLTVLTTNAITVAVKRKP